MEKFEELESIWNQQVDAIPKLNSAAIKIEADKNIKKIKKTHFFTIGILSITLFVLLYYFFWLYKNVTSSQIKGLEIMIIVLIIRVILEVLSIFQFKKIDFTASFKNYTNQLLSFYKFRKAIHFALTPLIYLSYCFGFILLLPIFKENFSQGFYLYLQISGFGFLTVFSYFLYKSAKVDLNTLKFLKDFK